HFALSKIHYWGQKLSERTNKSLSKQNTFAHVIMELTCFFYLQVAESQLSIHFFPPNEETNSYNSEQSPDKDDSIHICCSIWEMYSFFCLVLCLIVVFGFPAYVYLFPSCTCLLS